MEVVSTNHLPTASLVWQSRPGTWTLTVVCKAEYSLLPGEARIEDSHEDPLENDDYWDDDERNSLRAASDLAPFKQRADVVLVGQAFSPRGQPAASIVTRLVVGDIDKSIEVFADRAWAQDGQLREGPRFTKLPLRWERAAGGPETMNPVGVRADADPDRYGMLPIPNLVAPGTRLAGPRGYIEPVGYGPIAPSWPLRRGKLYHHAGAWPYPGCYNQPFPEGIDLAFFNVAPADQRLAEIRGDERIMLENLHPDHPRLVTALPGGPPPRAIVERANGRGEPVPLRCDTLAIDTDRGCLTLVWRAQIQLDHPGQVGRVVISTDVPSQQPSASGPVRAQTIDASAIRALQALPFSGRAAAAQVPAPPPMAPPPMVRAQVASDPIAPPSAGSAWSGGDARPAGGGLSLGQLAASQPSEAAPAPASAERWSPPASAPASEARPAARAERTEVIQLVWFDGASLPRVRRKAAWRGILAEFEDTAPDPETDDPVLAKEPAEIEDRRDVLAILARAEAATADGLNAEVAAGVRDDGCHVPRLVLVAGDIVFPFDELDALKATVTTASPLAGSDDGLKSALETAKDFLRTPDLKSAPQVAEALTTRIRDAFAQGRRAVPPGYLDTQTERALLDQRCYQKRAVLGATHLRGLLQVTGATAPVPAYVPESIAKLLPLYQRFKAKIIAEAHLAVDQHEQHPAALKVAALARLAPAPKR